MSRTSLWPAGIYSRGHYIAPEILDAAWEEWKPERGYISLGLKIETRMYLTVIDHYRVADRMMQKARKAGLIQHLGKGVWGYVL